MAASSSGWYRSMGCSVMVEASSGDRQTSKKSWLPFVSLYSGRPHPHQRLPGISERGNGTRQVSTGCE